MELLTERYCQEISGIISCYDRVVLQGTIKSFSYAQGMTARIAKENGVEIEFIRKKDFRKEDRIAKIIKERGSHPGLVHIFSAMEACSSYKPWHNKQTGGWLIC